MLTGRGLFHACTDKREAEEPGVVSIYQDIIFHYTSDPVQAIQQATEIGATVILQDLVMPEIDGLLLLRFLRANAATCQIPMIVLSVKEEANLKADAFAAGANDYLVKLPDPIELIARIRYHSQAYISLLHENFSSRRQRNQSSCD